MCKLIVVTNRALCQDDFLERIGLLCEAGVDCIVLREKDLSEWEYQCLAEQVLNICSKYQVECFLHKYFYTAIKLHAAGVHMSVSDAMKHRLVLQEVPVLGISAHSLDQIYMAQACHADYVFYGHVFPTGCKPGVEPRGIDSLSRVCEKSTLPIYAIGGIMKERVPMVMGAGASGACVMSLGMTASFSEIVELKKVCHEHRPG